MTQPADLDRLLAHAEWLRALARRLVGSSDVDDVVQETFVAAMRMPPEPDRPPRPWLARVMINVSRMRFRSTSRRERREDAVAQDTPSATPDVIVQRLELQRALCEHVLALDEPYRRTLVLHYFDGLTLAEIARTDAIAEGTVRWRHKHALDRLRVRLDEKSGGDRSAWVAALAPIAAPKPAIVAGGLLVKKLVIGIALALAAIAVVWNVSARQSEPPLVRAAAAPPTAHVHFGYQLPALPSTTRGSIHGSVVGGETANEVALFALVGGAPSFVARQTGTRFEFAMLEAGSYCVVARSGPRLGSACDLELREGTRIERNIELTLGDANLHGVVADADGGVIGEPLVVVQRIPQLDAVAAIRGDATGHYSIALAAGWYRVTAHADSYTTTHRHVEVAGDVRLDLHLNAGATVTGRVVDENGAPASNATVTLVTGWRTTRSSAPTGSDGKFAIEGLRPGHFEIMAFAGDRIAPLQPVAVTFGSTHELELVVGETRAAIEGQLVDDSNKPVAHALIEIRGPLVRVTHTDEAGKFRHPNLVPGSYTVSAIADGFVRVSSEKLVGHDRTTVVALRVARGVTVTGHVIGANGQPVGGARVASSAVNLRDPRLDTQTTSDGTFRIGPVPPGRVLLSAFHPVHGVSEVATVEVPRGSAPTAELVFRASASITGRVLADDGKPTSGALVTITPNEAPARWTLAAKPDGTFTLASLPAGNYHIEAAPPTGAARQTVADEASSRRVALVAGEATIVELRVPGGAERIRGRIVDAQTNAPVAGAAVWVEREGMLVSPGSPDDVRTYSWNDGGFELAEIPRGTYTIYGSHPTHGTGKLASIAAGASGVTIAIDRTASIAGRITTADGAPVQSFQVMWRWVTRTAGGGESMSRSIRMFHARDGRFRIANLEPTRLAVISIETPDGATGDSETFALAAGNHKDLDVELKGGNGTLRGRIVDATTRAPVLGLLVFFPAAGSREMVPVDGDGRFEALLPAGTYNHFNIQSGGNGHPNIEVPYTIKSGSVVDLGDVVVTLRK